MLKLCNDIKKKKKQIGWFYYDKTKQKVSDWKQIK